MLQVDQLQQEHTLCIIILKTQQNILTTHPLTIADALGQNGTLLSQR